MLSKTHPEPWRSALATISWSLSPRPLRVDQTYLTSVIDRLYVCGVILVVMADNFHGFVFSLSACCAMWTDYKRLFHHRALNLVFNRSNSSEG